jgi:S-adenosylmethionine:tRNA-ribosyltransferase-isomerase (queuine synthetase)
MRLSEFDYALPEELIAQEPPAERDGARMLVVERATGRWYDRTFRDLPEYIHPGDCVVLNDSRVLPSRLHGVREGGAGAVEVLLLESTSPDALEWTALVRPGRKLMPGARVRFGETLTAEILTRGERGERTLRFSGESDIYAALTASATCPCRRTFAARIAAKTANAIRPSMRASAVRSPRPPLACTSLPRCSTASVPLVAASSASPCTSV